MSENNGANRRDINSQLPTDSIKEMLRYAALSDGELEMEQIDRLLAELNTREPKDGGTTVDDAWKVFNKEYSGNPSPYLDCAYGSSQTCKQKAKAAKPHWRKVFRKFLVAAAVASVIFATMIAVQAVGVDVFGAIGRWTDEMFSFSAAQKRAAPPIAFSTAGEDKEYSTLQDVLYDFAIAEVAEPTWLPEGYKIKQVYITADEGDELFIAHATYKNGEDQLLSVGYKYTLGGKRLGSVYEKSDVEPVIYQHGKQIFYMFPNIDTNKIVWATDNFECCISGYVSYEDLEKMVNSIY